MCKNSENVEDRSGKMEVFILRKLGAGNLLLLLALFRVLVAAAQPPQPIPGKELKHATQSELIRLKFLLLYHVRNSLSGRVSYCH